MIDESVRFLVGAGQARRVRRRALLRRLARRPRVRAALRDRGRRSGRRGRLPLRHQRGGAAAVRRGRRPRGHGGPARRGRRHPRAQRQRLRRRQQPRGCRAPARARCRAPINGYGERCGNANLVSIIPALKLKMGFHVVSDEQLERLTETSHFVADVVNAAIWAHAPYVGRSAFAHKGGMHVAAVEKAPQTFEHVDPEKVGNEQRIVVSELSGKGAVLRKAQELGLQLEGDDARVATVLRRLKDARARGLPLRGRRRLVRPAAAPGAGAARAAVPPRELPRASSRSARTARRWSRRRSRSTSAASASSAPPRATAP